MSTVTILVEGGRTREFCPPKLPRMLQGACCRFSLKQNEEGRNDLGLRPDDVDVFPSGELSLNGAKCPLQLTVGFSADLLERLAPPLDPTTPAERDDSALRRLAQEIGETARSLGPENGWAPRDVKVRIAIPQQPEVSWASS